MTEARARVLVVLAGTSAISKDQLQALARTAYHAARDAWHQVAEPDPESGGVDD